MMAHLNNTEADSEPLTSKSLTEVRRLKEHDGTYEVTLVEQSRRKLTTEDELIPIIAEKAYEAQRAVEHSHHLLLGEKDVYLAFARRFLGYLKDDGPKLFEDFFNEIRDWPRQADDAGNDLLATGSMVGAGHSEAQKGVDTE